MSLGILNEKNPLTKYKRKHPFRHWKDIGKDVGVSEATIIRIAKKDHEALLRLSIGIYLKFQEVLQIDLIKDYEHPTK